MSKIHVLVVEDEPTLARIIKDALEANDFKVSLAADGVAGLEAFARVAPDILVADIMMPQLSGLDMVRKIRETDRHTPILFLTAKSTVDDVVEGFHAGGNDYLKKPPSRNGKRCQSETTSSTLANERWSTCPRAKATNCPTGKARFCNASAATHTPLSPPRTSCWTFGATMTSSARAASRPSSPACAAASPKTPM